MKWSSFLLIDYLFLDENTCNFCHSEYIYKYGLCRDCFDKLDYVDNRFLVGSYDCYVIYFYNEFMKRIIGKYKFERKTEFSKIFSKIIYDYGNEKNLFDVDFILPSPSSRETLINRGFDHIRMITDDFIDKINPVYLEGFKKIKDTKAQHELDRQARSKNLLDAFTFERDLTGKSVLIIDDMVTTGNTSLEIIKVLEKSNVKDIKILALASEKRVL